MNESYLITGSPSPFLKGLVSRLIKAGNQVTVLVDSSLPEELGDYDPEQLILIPSNPRSPLPLRSFLLGLRTSERSLDHVVHLFHPKTQGKTLSELDSASIDRSIDTDLKGLLFPVREVLAQFQRQGRGSLDFVCIGGLSTLLAPLEAAAFGAIQELAKSLFILYQNEPVTIRGLHLDVDLGEQKILQTIIDSIRENSPKARGKWNRMATRSGPFSFRRNAP